MAMPPCGENLARAVYAEVLGMADVAEPEGSQPPR